jgi:indoleamine 2,3-dioxygenase
MQRMPESCDPYVYYHRVRPYIFGWHNNPALPGGLVYEGVTAYAGKPQSFRGETGAQSTIVPCLDAVLGVEHAPDELRTYLMEMRRYMPRKHVGLLEAFEAGPTALSRVTALGGAAPAGLVAARNRAVDLLRAFRALHLEYAATYINRQAAAATGNPTDVGTGGTPFMKYLKKHRDETESSLTKS